MSMQLLYRLKTADFFQTECAPQEENDEENWPPFRKVGTFDPYSDDPKLGIQKIIMCPLKETLVIAGTAGQVLIMNINEKSYAEQSLKLHKINIVTDMDNFIWKGHDPLPIRETAKLSSGYQPVSIIQLYPPATVSALCLNTDWKLIGMGTSHGFALYDFVQQRELLVRCTLDPQLLLSYADNSNGAAATATGAISRRKSLKKSLRESFRKLRRGRSQKTTTTKKPEVQQHNNNNGTMRPEQIDDVS
jgi:lethal(2) giant larvae protein